MRQMYGVDNSLPRLDPQGGRNIRLAVSLASLVLSLFMPSFFKLVCKYFIKKDYSETMYVVNF